MKYEEKFDGLLAAIKKAQAEKAEFIIVPTPETLGHDYSELIESLKRIAVAGLALKIPALPKSPGPHSALN